MNQEKIMSQAEDQWLDDLNDEQRYKLQDAYVHAVIDDMDMDSLIQYASDALSHYLDKESDEELIDTVKEIYPELLNAN